MKQASHQHAMAPPFEPLISSTPDAGAGGRAPLVTVIAACYNHARFLVDCLDSIQAQTLQDFELIVSDDASSDDSAALIRDWIAGHRPEAVFVHHTRNRGLCPTLNELLALARGRYVSMIATDDLWEPDKLQKLVDAMEPRPEVAVAYSDAHQIDEAGRLLPESFMTAQKCPQERAPSGRVFSALVDKNVVPAMSTLIRREALQAVGGYDEKLTYEDYDMWLRLAARYEFLFVPGHVARYRIVATSMTRTLFARPTPQHSRTQIRIVDKWMGSGLLTPAQRTRWLKNQIDGAYGLFFHDQADAGKELLRAGLRARSPYWVLLGLAALLGLRRGHLQRLRRQ